MKSPKHTLVLGASDNPARYSHMAIERLRQGGHPVKAVGRKHSIVGDVPIETATKEWMDIHTVTLYLNPDHQKPYEDYILSLDPDRIIFNPGAENPDLEKRAREKGIQTMNACTLVMLSTGQY
jgi:predicted CoA-binding protein